MARNSMRNASYPLNCFTLGPIYWNGDSLEPVTMWIDLFLIGKPFVKITLQISISKTGYGTYIADQFMHRHQIQAMDWIAPRTVSHCQSQTCSAIA